LADNLAIEEGRISSEVYSQLLTMPIENLNEKAAAEHQFVTLSSTSRLTNSVLLPMLNLTSDLFTIFFLFSTSIIISPLTGAVLLFTLVFTYYLANVKLSAVTSRLGSISARNSIELIDLIYGTIRGIKEVRSYNLESRLLDQFKLAREVLAHAVQRSTLLNGIFRFIADLAVIFLGLLFLILQYFVENDVRRSVVVLILYLAVGYRLIPTIQRLQGTINSLRLSKPTLQPLFELANDLDGEVNSTSKSELNSDAIGVKAFNLSFEFFEGNGNTRKLFRNVSFSLKPNSILVLWGKSGSGKTTLLDIIAGLRQPTQGKIEYDGNGSILPISHAKSYVTQEPFLLKGPLIDSLRIETSKSISAKAPIQELIRKFNMRKEFLDLENFILEENCRNISGGEKQRLSLIKASVSQNRLILLDEPTSSLDAKTRKIVVRHLKKLAQNHTLIIATHDMEIKEIADQVIELSSHD
jgi:ATP-binding cassette subfamily B protein